MMRASLCRSVACAGLLVTLPSFALEISVAEPEATLLGAEASFSLEVTDPTGAAEIRWNFGDGEQTEFVLDQTEATHTYSAPGHYPVIVVARDEVGFQSASFVHTVHYPVLEEASQQSGPLAYLPEQGEVVATNEDNDTVTFVDAETLQKVEELPVHDGPVAVAVAPDGNIWVVHRDDHSIAVLDPGSHAIVETLELPYGSQPMGVVFSLDGSAYLPLMALGEVLRIDVSTGQILGRSFIAPHLRGISLSGDGTDLWVTRFISPEGRGEVFHLNPETLQLITRYDLEEDTTTIDSDVQGRGLPNYLFSVALSPDGREAWIPGKKDNVARGVQRDGLPLTPDNTVRPLISILDLNSATELYDERIDLDDRNLPRQVTFSPLGDYVFVTIFGSNQVEVWDAYSRSLVTGMRGGKGPIATLLAPDERLFVLGDLSRTLTVYNVRSILSGLDQTTRLLEEIPLVENEVLTDEVLLGKQLFSNADDVRMASEGYLSCASCHIEGFEDGRVWEFADRGEGLRNTTSLLGRRGTGHGPVHWSGNFDEIQDFEGAIRGGQGGIGFMRDEDFVSGTHGDPLGDPKAGLSADLDAMAAYVTALDEFPKSPYRNQDGSMTEAALLGEQLFKDLACDSCHSGEDFTDSALGVLHDVGTLTPESGSRLGAELLGIDTPTLLGIWQTAPYLHDGSAATLLEVLTTKNPENRHGETSGLTDTQLDRLIAYLMQLEYEPSDTEPDPSMGGTLGMGGDSGTDGTGGDGIGGSGGIGNVASGGDMSLGPSDGDPGSARSDVSGCGCVVAGKRGPKPLGDAIFLLGAAFLASRLRRRFGLEHGGI